MGQERRPVHIPDRVDSGIGGLQLRVDLHIAALKPDAGLFQTEIGTNRRPTDSHQDLIGRAFLGAGRRYPG